MFEEEVAAEDESLVSPPSLPLLFFCDFPPLLIYFILVSFVDDVEVAIPLMLLPSRTRKQPHSLHMLQQIQLLHILAFTAMVLALVSPTRIW